jgi:hypothetical protein
MPWLSTSMTYYPVERDVRGTVANERLEQTNAPEPAAQPRR